MRSERDKRKALEQEWMVLKEQYSDLCRAAGIPENALWGDPIWSHESCVSHIERLLATYGKERK